MKLKANLPNMISKLYQLFFRCGVSIDDYKAIKPRILEINFNTWKYIHSLLAFLSLLCLILIFTVESININEYFIYFTLAYSVIFGFLFFKVLKPQSMFADIEILITIGLLFATGIVIDNNPNQLSISFIILLILAPMLRVGRPYWIAILMTLAALVYFFLIKHVYVKSNNIITLDIIDVILAGFIGLIISVYNNYLRVKDILNAKINDEEKTETINEKTIELEEKNKELKIALDAATASSKAKTTFLFNMSHDIRTPMNAIMGFTDLAMKDINNSEKAMIHLKKSKESSEHLLNLINDILDMSRIESGKLELSETANNIEVVVNNSLPMLTSLSEKKHQELIVDINNIENKELYFDNLRLNQVIINIVSNAVKYTPEFGKINYTVKQLPSSIKGYAIINFIIKDNGIGMEKSFLPHIFEQFSREKTSTVSKLQGTGLGLAITKRIVDIMKGSIDVESEVGVGTTFSISIPFKIQEKSLVKQSNNEGEDVELIDLTGKKCLLVEDNELNREISNEILGSVGLIVDNAEDGLIAVNTIKDKGPNYYDIVLMDIQMPVMDGYEATKTIRALFPEVHVPIIALSANAFEEDKKKSLLIGMDDHQSKPIVLSELLVAISKLLKK